MSKYVEFNIDDDFLSKHYPDILDEVVKATILDIENEKVTPFFTGATQDSMWDASVVYKKEAAIINDTPYASKIYRQVGHSFRQDPNTKAQAEWYNAYLNDCNGEEFITKAFADAVKKHGGA